MSAEGVVDQIEVPRSSAWCRGPTAQEWEDKKHIIRDLYLVQGLTLELVRETMRQEHRFCATTKMYKLRFARWDFRKNNNLENMTILAHRIKVAELEGADPNEFASTKEVERYFKRRRVSSIEDGIGRPRKLGRGQAGVYSARNRLRSTFKDHKSYPEFGHGTSKAHAVSGNSQTFHDVHWAPLQEAHHPFTSSEMVLKMISIYYVGSCEANVWYTCERGRFKSRKPVNNASTLLDCFVSSWKLGLDLLSRGFTKRFRRTVYTICHDNSEIIVAEHPSTIRALLEMLLAYARAGHHQIASTILKSFVAAAPGPYHPIAILCRQLLQVDPEAVEQVALSAMTCAMQTLSKQCGDDHYAVVRCAVALLEAEGQRNTPTYVVQKSEQIRESYKASLQFSREGYFNVAECQVSALCRRGEFAEAERILEEIQRWTTQFTIGPEDRWPTKCADLLSEVQYSQGKYELAEANVRRCIEARGWSPDGTLVDARSIACATRLSGWLRSWNRGDEAEEIEQDLLKFSTV